MRLSLFISSLYVSFASCFFVPACRISELSRSSAVTLDRDGVRVALILDEDRVPQAYRGHCPHRGADFDGARARDGALHCRYHDFAYDVKTGRLASGLGVAPGCALLKKYPCAVVDDLVWVCLDGDDAPPPPPSLISGRSGFRSIVGSCFIRCTVAALVANVLDPVHISFVHSFGNSMSPEPMGYAHVEECDRRGGAEFYYVAGPSSMFRKSTVKVENWYMMPSTAGTTVLNGDMDKTVQVHAVREGDGTRVFWELARNFAMHPWLDPLFRFAMERTLGEDRDILEACEPDEGGLFHCKYDGLQLRYARAMKRAARISEAEKSRVVEK